jgi:hypothetical protein
VAKKNSEDYFCENLRPDSYREREIKNRTTLFGIEIKSQETKEKMKNISAFVAKK